jgi:hypothetical protein
MRPAAFARVLEKRRPDQPRRLYEVRSVVPDVADLLVDRPEPAGRPQVPGAARCQGRRRSDLAKAANLLSR